MQIRLREKIWPPQVPYGKIGMRDNRKGEQKKKVSNGIFASFPNTNLCMSMLLY